MRHGAHGLVGPDVGVELRIADNPGPTNYWGPPTKKARAGGGAGRRDVDKLLQLCLSLGPEALELLLAEVGGGDALHGVVGARVRDGAHGLVCLADDCLLYTSDAADE